MKYQIVLLISIISANSFAQNSNNQKIDLLNIKDTPTEEVEAFAPTRKLLNSDLWERVSANRFECSFLRLAVELKGFNYLLIEMDEPKRVMAESSDYQKITLVICKLTLRSSPQIPNSISTDLKNI